VVAQPFIKIKFEAVLVRIWSRVETKTVLRRLSFVFEHRRDTTMKRTALALTAAAIIGVTALTAPSPAEARWRGGWGPGIAGGLIGAAIIGGLASSAYAYGPGYGYYGYPYAGGYAPAYYGGYGYAPYAWGGYPTYSGYSPGFTAIAIAALFDRRLPTTAAPIHALYFITTAGIATTGEWERAVRPGARICTGPNPLPDAMTTWNGFAAPQGAVEEHGLAVARRIPGRDE
jgi:hypothetical protein